MSFGGSGFTSGGTQGAALAVEYGAPVQTIAELRAIGEVDRNDQMLRLVEDKGVSYRFDLQGVGADDGNLTIVPTVGSGRWFKTSEPGGGPPAVHAPSHTDGSDDIQSATAGQKGVATSTQITKLDGIEALADVTDATNVATATAVMDADFAAGEGFMRKTGAGAYLVHKSNLSAIFDPVVGDDDVAGYSVGSRWLNTVLQEEFVALDVTTGAAVWVNTTGMGDLAAGTDVITAAITALAAGGGKVILAEGTFTVDAADTTFDKGDVVIEGQGPATIIDLTGTTATKAFDIGAFDNITIRNLTIRLNDVGGGLTGIAFASGQSGHRVENVVFENVLGANTAFIDVNSSTSVMKDCEGSVTAGSIATAIVSATGPTGLLINYCRFDGANSGISLFHNEAEISHCHITDVKTGTGIKLEGDRCKINGGSITLTAGAVVITAIEIAATALNTTIDDVTITGTGNTQTNSIGINVITGADKCSMTGCRFITLPGKAVNVFATRAAITGCNFQGSSGSAAAITLNGPGSSITGGHIEDFDTAIDLVTAGESTVSNVNIILRDVVGARGIKVAGDLCTLTGNNIDGNGAGGSNIFGIELASGGRGGSITGGSIRNFAANGVAIAVTGTHIDASIADVQIDAVRHGIQIATGASRAKIHGCKFRTLGGDGILLASVVECEVHDNHFSAVTGTEILETGTADFNSIKLNYVKGGTITTVGTSTEVAGNFPEVRTVLEGSQDLTAGTPVNKNITGYTRGRKIKRGRFWISANGADVGANATTRIQLKFFNTDGFLHAELDTTFIEGLIEDFGEFQFESQDVKVAADNGDGTIDIDDTAEFGIDDLVRVHDGTNFEYQRLDAITDADTVSLYDTILKSGVGAWSVNDDVTRVFEIRDLTYKDEDDTDEIHLRMMPRSGDSDCRLHFAFEYEGGA